MPIHTKTELYECIENARALKPLLKTTKKENNEYYIQLQSFSHQQDLKFRLSQNFLSRSKKQGKLFTEASASVRLLLAMDLPHPPSQVLVSSILQYRLWETYHFPVVPIFGVGTVIRTTPNQKKDPDARCKILMSLWDFVICTSFVWIACSPETINWDNSIVSGWHS